jgi:hypothetical protein
MTREVYDAHARRSNRRERQSVAGGIFHHV